MAGIEGMTWHLGVAENQVDSVLNRWTDGGLVERLWQKDAGLWTGQDESKWLGWLDSVAWMQEQVSDLTEFAKKVQADGFTDVLVLGMGGSSLCPEVLAMSFGDQDRWPKLHVLDSTVPEQVKRFCDELNLSTTLCIVASKSGTTTEPNTFCDYFWAQVQGAVGSGAGAHFVAITDPGSALAELAEELGFRQTFLGRPEIGGRFSALSPFGLVPAALMGIDLNAFLDGAAQMVARCKKPPFQNPGVILGAILGTLAKGGRDKVTLFTSDQIWDLGAWLEQLIAESTGKEGVGIVPVDQEKIGNLQVYGQDRVFVQIRLASQPNVKQDKAVEELKQAGHPVVQIDMDNIMDLGAEFFRWEIATAVAGEVLNIHPFNQPNVQESKDFTAELTTAYEETGVLPEPAFQVVDNGLAVYADTNNEAVIVPQNFEATLAKHLGRIEKNDYVAICAYLDMRPEVVEALAKLRHNLRNQFQVATTLGFGPRFLHSTGQLHKGGANNVFILQLTADDPQDLEIPGRKFSFKTLKDAQALGDASALSMRKRRALRIHIQGDLLAGIQRLITAAERV